MREQRGRDEREVVEREEEFGESYEQRKRGWSGMFLEEKEDGQSMSS